VEAQSTIQQEESSFAPTGENSTLEQFIPSEKDTLPSFESVKFQHGRPEIPSTADLRTLAAQQHTSADVSILKQSGWDALSRFTPKDMVLTVASTDQPSLLTLWLSRELASLVAEPLEDMTVPVPRMAPGSPSQSWERGSFNIFNLTAESWLEIKKHIGTAYSIGLSYTLTIPHENNYCAFCTVRLSPDFGQYLASNSIFARKRTDGIH
jgi:hypothetical protein